jgi:N-acetylmuramoyl-L-alanine amidase
MTLKIVECPSPNHDERPAGAAVDILVMHYTGMKTADEALARLTDPEARVSAHYTVGSDGRVFRHVSEDRRAWHAGVSWWAGERNVNARSIGIEIVNPGHEFGYIPFPEEQIEAVIELSRGILARHPIPPSRILGHSDVAPARKEDPGELFPWQYLAKNGIGVWPTIRGYSSACGEAGSARSGETERAKGEAEGGIGALAEQLKRYGYGLPPDVDVPLEKVITAFQRHFRPSRLTGEWDYECRSALAALLEKM